MRTLKVLAVLTCLSLFLPGRLEAAEMRGLWVDAFHPGFKSAEETSAMVAKAKDCNFNALFVQVRKRGDVYYESAIEPKANDVDAAYDPLADVITKAHAAGLEVHAWISVYEVYHDTKWNDPHSQQVHLKRPDWLMKDYLGRTTFYGEKLFLDPGVPEVQAYLVSIVDELVKDYAVDGIHLDIARYPGREAGYNSASIARFNLDAGRTGKPESEDETWCTWRRAQVTSFVQSAYQKATSIKPAVKVSAAVFANRTSAFHQHFQDWEGWLKAGILDFAVPMVFPKDNQVFQKSAAEVAAVPTNGRHIYLGQGGYRLGAAQGVEQISMARQAGFGGIVVYSYHYCARPQPNQSSSMMDALKAGLFAEADTVPVMSWKQ